MLERVELILGKAEESYPEGHPDRIAAGKIRQMTREYLDSRKRSLEIELFEINQIEGVVPQQPEFNLRGLNGLVLVRDAVLVTFDISYDDFVSGSRLRKFTRARKAFCYISSEKVKNVTWREIALALGGRDHSTALHHHSTAPKYMEEEPDFKNQVDEALDLLRPEKPL